MRISDWSSDVCSSDLIAQRFDRVEALLRIGIQCALRWHQKIRVAAMMRAADATAQLVQLREAEMLGAIDQNRVGARYVDAGLDDRGDRKSTRLNSSP